MYNKKIHQRSGLCFKDILDHPGIHIDKMPNQTKQTIDFRLNKPLTVPEFSLQECLHIRYDWQVS